ncbi:hypothetical protein CCHR01_19475 [Colletotrichum chrysophilum]|uniref:Uncharacterized protein n=1 Tax=Colletotrichum chrysophilum TaxID=1836956 RepID=A0AAD9E7S6_9PEZI|nr:hypothetical protein CCHR01_19475 [Colletotrichum chrysophilum]
MYPWKDAFDSWTGSTQLQIDALGLITIVGADEVNVSVGRLVPNPYSGWYSRPIPAVWGMQIGSGNWPQYNRTIAIDTRRNEDRQDEEALSQRHSLCDDSLFKLTVANEKCFMLYSTLFHLSARTRLFLAVTLCDLVRLYPHPTWRSLWL